MTPVKKLFYLASKDGFGFRETEMEVVEFRTAETYLRISACTYDSHPLLITLTHDEVNTLLDFKNASDYQVLYLDKNYFVTGGTYARNNTSGFQIQTQNKILLLLFLKKP